MRAPARNEPGHAALTAKTRTAYRTWAEGVISAATNHWPEYLMEGVCLALFMVSASTLTVLLQHPASATRQVPPSAFVRRFLTGVAMGETTIALIYSPWGKQSGRAFRSVCDADVFSGWERLMPGTPVSTSPRSSLAELLVSC